MTRRPGRYQVGLFATGVGLLSFLALPFATLRSSRIQTGDGLSAAAALGWPLAVAVVVLWLIIGASSLVRGARPVAFLRGALGASMIITIIALSGWAAADLTAQTGRFARVSIGSGAWVSMIAAYAVVLASRRLVGRRSVPGILLAAAVPFALIGMLGTGFLGDLGIMKEYANVAERFWVETLNTVVYALASVGLATGIGVALGIAAYKRPRSERAVFTTVSVFQTIPGLAMVGLLVAPLAAVSFAFPFLRELGIGGIGWAPVVISLTLYALLSIVRNTHAGLRGVSPTVIDAGRGMGMSGGELLRRVELPLGAQVAFSGVRTSAVQTIGNATLGAFVGGITLGRFIFQGLAEQAPDLTMLGSITLVIIALAVDGAMRGLQALLFHSPSWMVQGSSP